MADRVYPASKPPTTAVPTDTANGATTATANPTFPANKAQLYNANRPAYRPQPHHRRKHSRSCCCRCCCWTILLVILIILIAAIAAAVFYLIYRPHRPTFTVSSLKVSTLNLTSSSHLTTDISLSVTAKNPNKNVIYFYDPATITITTVKDDINIGTGSFPSFEHKAKNTTLLKSTIASANQQLDDVTAVQLKSHLKNQNGFPLKIELDTKVKAKMGALKTPKVGIRVTCLGIKTTVPSGKTAVTASTSNVKCKVDMRIKIWKWTL